MRFFHEEHSIIFSLRQSIGRWLQSLATRFNQVRAYRFVGLAVLMGALVLGCLGGGVDRQVRSPSPSTVSRLPSSSSEIRGVWITNVASSVLFAPWGISRAVHQLADMHFNQVYPVVWNRGHTFYRSAALEKITGQPVDPLLAFAHPLTEPLRELVRLSHQQQLRVVPWFEYGFMVPMNSELVRRHPDWLTSRQDGSRRLEDAFAGEAEALPNGLLSRLLSSGAPTQLGWLNPFHPGVQGLLLALVEEVVSEYDVDGIQFDDHFSLPVAFGYDTYTVSLYQAEHQGQAPPSNPADPGWMRWRADKLSQFMNILHAKVKAKCRTCLVSLSPNPAKFAYRFYLQDWQTWVDRGWLDELVVQVYRDDLLRFEGELGKAALQTARDRIPVSIGILTGTWRHPIPFEQIRQQVTSSRDYHFSGVSFFYWDTLWSYFTPEPPAQRRQNFQHLMSNVFAR